MVVLVLFHVSVYNVQKSFDTVGECGACKTIGAARRIVVYWALYSGPPSMKTHMSEISPTLLAQAQVEANQGTSTWTMSPNHHRVSKGRVINPKPNTLSPLSIGSNISSRGSSAADRSTSSTSRGRYFCSQ